jgi:pyruvate formate lyase activating enzyme
MIIGGFQPFTLSDFPGRTAAIVFTQGCNFRCPFCHNRRLWASEVDGPLRKSDQGSNEASHHKTEADVLTFLTRRQGYLSGLVITGGEPTLQPDLPDFIRKVTCLGLAVKLDTNGSRPEIIRDLLANGLVDYTAMDIKAPLDKYDQLCGGFVDTAAIRESMDIIAASAVPHHFRTTFYKALLSDADIRAVKNMMPPHSDFRIQPCRDPK